MCDLRGPVLKRFRCGLISEEVVDAVLVTQGNLLDNGLHGSLKIDLQCFKLWPY